MIGFEAITHHNGWVTAATGACIVFSGLATLSLIISQLHKFVALLDRPPKAQVVVALAPQPPPRPECPLDHAVAVERLQPLIEELELEFDLAELYALAKKYHLPHPHLSIRCLLNAGTLQPLGDGVFRFVKAAKDI
ncbi:OadG family transporter subunit [Desulfobulbus sp.]|uniref:OadG family transporter subunit n=1 Tax=Desulfobulbus sp. TaxID=895 RepID=UPI00286F0AD1|nr:OadG family transporter subunit [Desulfobulbus sp.]